MLVGQEKQPGGTVSRITLTANPNFVNILIARFWHKFDKFERGVQANNLNYRATSYERILYYKTGNHETMRQ